MNKHYLLLKLIWRLGLLNIVRVLFYRFKVKFGIFRFKKPLNLRHNLDIFLPNGPLTTSLNSPAIDLSSSITNRADQCIAGELPLFFHRTYQTTSPPNWFVHPEYSIRQHWTEIPINQIVGHDVKLTWDLSRFYWLQLLAAAYQRTHDTVYLNAMNTWLRHWIEHNPVDCSVNWVCAQECAIRLIHVLNAFYMIKDSLLVSEALKQFVIAHCRRITPTITYSLAQDNNHGTSEAAGLYIGGAWLASLPDLSPKLTQSAQRWKNKGRRILENRCARLIAADGSFSMYSTNYHRVVLNTMAIVEFWRRTLHLKPFTTSFGDKCKALTRWLYLLTDQLSGNVPNLGTNDGSNPFIFQPSSDYRDYRPAIQFASYLFYDALAYDNNGLLNEPLSFLGINTSGLKTWDICLDSEDISHSGLVVFHPSHLKSSHAFLKYSVPAFRPSQADILHFDVWLNGENILRDAGSYSYCPHDPQDQFYFSSIAAHNTIQIDDSEPMLKLSPFLFGHWIKMAVAGPLNKKNDQLMWQGSYQWPTGAVHQREVNCVDNQWIVSDMVKGARKRIVLRWRLKAADWVLKDNTLSNEDVTIRISEKNSIPFSIAIVNGYESPYYDLKEIVPILVIQANIDQAHFITQILV